MLYPDIVQSYPSLLNPTRSEQLRLRLLAHKVERSEGCGRIQTLDGAAPPADAHGQSPAPEPSPPAPTTLQLVAGYGDMEIEEEQEEPPADSMTDEMASFYSSLEPEEEQAEETTETPVNASAQAPTWAGKEALRPSPASDPSTTTMSPTSSTPSSPLPVEPKNKKRKKVKY